MFTTIRHGRRQVSGFYVSFLKIDFYRLFLNLLVFSLLGFTIWWGIKLFSRDNFFNPLVDSLIFIAEIISFIFLCIHTRANSWRPPNIFITAITLIVIAVIFAFAGVEPISSFKDSIIGKWDTYRSEQKAIYEENLERAKIEEQKKLEEQRIEEQQKLAEQKAKEAQIITDLNQNYAQLFNEFRKQNGKPPLTFDSKLNELAIQRAIEISQPGNFSHEGIMKYNLGENIAMLAYSTDSNTSLIELWANSSGHRSNMLSSMYMRTGFARVGKYAVQIFN